MIHRRKIIASVVAVLALSVAVVALILTSRYSQSGPKEYRIGVVLSLTGRGGTFGQRALNGMQLAVDEINATEPFRGRPIRLLVEDSRSSAPQALSAFRKLVDIDRVSVAIGFVLSDEVLTCAPVANERHVVIFSTAAGSDQIRDAGDYVFRNRESAHLQAEAIAQAAVQRFGFREVAILHSNAANGISYRDAFRDALQQLGGTVTLALGYNEGKTDYRAEIERLRAGSPRAVYLAGLDHELGLILKQAREVGFAPQFLSSAGAISQQLLTIAGPGADGLVSGSAPFNAESDDERVRAFVTGFRGRFGETPDFIAANSYDAVYILASLFSDGALDGDQIKAGLYATKDFPGVGGTTSFDAFGEVSKPIELVQVRSGAFVGLEGR